MERYDYIICGAGCAGLTFLYEILHYENLRGKQILVIDRLSKTENDRTWCFWEKEKSNIEEIIEHQWSNLSFESNNFAKSFSISPYHYKMINGLGFYNHILQFTANFKNVKFINEEIVEITNTQYGAIVKTNINNYECEYAFNSIIYGASVLKTENSLLQHFKGIVVETNNNVFNKTQATFMDFTVSQSNGASFMYVLPAAANKALIEYTLFTKNILQQQEYDEALKDYLGKKLKITDYKILHTEFGVIPMTDYKFQLNNGNIINIGTTAGCVKPSSGYTFKFIQKHTKKIVGLLAKGKKPILKHTFIDKKFLFYDSVLLEVLAQQKMKGDEIFAAIFKKNKPQTILKFLDNETSLWEDFKIMSSVPMKIFLPVAVKKLFKF